MPHRYLAISISVLFISLFINAEAQKKPTVKFGRPMPAEMSMTVYPKDSSAHAVILYDKGHFNSVTYQFTRHLRLKILNKAGSSYANFVVKTPSKSNIDGFTFNLRNGMIEEKKLSNDNIFREVIVEDYEVYKIFFPDVKEGSVIDLRYSHIGVPYEWHFQHLIPVVYNELILEPASDITYKKVMYGFEQVTKVGDFKFVAENVPGMVKEPMMGDYTNYVTKFKFDVEQIRFGSYVREFSSSWQKVGERLLEYELFGGVIRESAFLNEKARELRESKEPVTKKIESAYRFIHENIKWNEVSSVFASGSYRENFKKDHSGNSADINLLLVSLLKKADINAYPLILSTRDNGMLNPFSASLSSLNYVAAYVHEGDLKMILDATLKHPMPGILPERCRNISAWAADKVAGFWVDLNDGKFKVKRQFIVIDLNTPDHLTAEVTDSYEDYEFLNWIDHFEAEGSEEAYNRSMIAKTKEAEIEECKVLTLDKQKYKGTYKTKLVLNNSDFLQDLNDELHINPFILNEVTNPFKAESRKFPIDFIYPWNRSFIVSMKLPENYALSVLPESMSLVPEGGGARFSYRASLSNNLLSIKCDLKIEKQIFDESEYHSMRNFFTEVNRKLSEPLQVKKKT